MILFFLGLSMKDQVKNQLLYRSVHWGTFMRMQKIE